MRAWSLPDPDGRLGATVAKLVGGGAPASTAVYAAVGDTGAAAPLLGAIGALDAPGLVAIVGTGGGRTTGVLDRRRDAGPRRGARSTDALARRARR